MTQEMLENTPSYAAAQEARLAYLVARAGDDPDETKRLGGIFQNLMRKVLAEAGINGYVRPTVDR